MASGNRFLAIAPDFQSKNPSWFMSEQAPELPVESQKQEGWTPEPSGARTKPPAVSPLRRLLPPILGGLTACPIAIGILWYGFGKDIGNAGPTV
ncbi:MAG: hypothetical protein ACKOAH_06090, partial [Pirellula sp.]